MSARPASSNAETPSRNLRASRTMVRDVEGSAGAVKKKGELRIYVHKFLVFTSIPESMWASE